MSRTQLYFDEDAMQHALVVAQRAARDVSTASDSGMVAEATKSIFVMPVSTGGYCIVSTSGITACSTSNGSPAGGTLWIILASQQRYSIGE